MISIEDVNARHCASGAAAGLTDDRVEAGRRVTLAEDEVHVVRPELLLEGEAIPDGALIRNEGETTLS